MRTSAAVMICLLLSVATPARAGGEAVGAGPVNRRLADCAPRLDALDLPGSERFGIRMRARSARGNGSLTFDSHLTLRTRRDGSQIVLEDTWEIMGRTFDLSMRCRPDALLSMQRCSFAMQRGDDRRTAQIQVEDQTAIITVGDRRVEMRHPGETITQSALFRLIPQLPREPGVVFGFDAYVEALDMQVRTPAEGESFRIVCRGSETIQLNDAPVECTRYTVITDRPVEFFVDAASRLRKVVADGGDTVLVRLDPPVAAGVE